MSLETKTARSKVRFQAGATHDHVMLGESVKDSPGSLCRWVVVPPGDLMGKACDASSRRVNWGSAESPLGHLAGVAVAD